MVAGVFCLPFLLVGGLFTLIGYLSYRSEKRKNALCTETVHAVVSELRRISDKDGTTYKPFFTAAILIQCRLLLARLATGRSFRKVLSGRFT